MESINDIASKHLGRNSDGSVAKPYETPSEVDPSLLVAVPRALNRVAYGIKDDDLPFCGRDAWNAYEFSTLLENGFPATGWVKIVYSSDTPSIVESKSLKLYLNSYNMAKTMKNLSVDEYMKIENRISADLSKVVGADTISQDVGVYFSYEPEPTLAKPIIGNFIHLEDWCDVTSMEFTDYQEDPDIIKIDKLQGPDTRLWRSRSLRSNCRVTNQPDWGDVFIAINTTTGLQPTPESLLKYIVSMRRENHFHEEIAEMIYKRLDSVVRPAELFVACLYSRRGGIDINPVRASSSDVLYKYGSNIIHCMTPCSKTDKQ